MVLSGLEPPSVDGLPLVMPDTGVEEVDSRKHNVVSRVISDADSEAEAMATLQLAVTFKERGKVDKAKKLFKHAYALQPTHPDVLTEYGLFMEQVKNDVIRAEHLFNRALSVCPKHTLALDASRRTTPLVEEIDDRMLRNIDYMRDYFARVAVDSRQAAALQRAKREAYFQHVHHTVAIEGNTMTLVQTRVVLETRVAIAGKSLVEHNEILGMDAALRFLDQVLVPRLTELKIDDILDLHKRVFGYVDPIEAGQFRNTQVYVGKFAPTPPQDIMKEMLEFISWMNGDAQSLHPVELAALAHYKFVIIHPFIDGNGRTSRLLMNMILMQNGFPPVIIRVNDRLEYYETLQMANEGDVRPFIRFIARCTERTLKEYLDMIENPGKGLVIGAQSQLTSEFKAHLQCTQTEIVVQVYHVDGLPFSASVYVEGFYKKDGCHEDVYNTLKHIFRVPYNRCGMKKSGNAYTSVVVVQRRSKIMTKSDAVFELRCSIDGATNTWRNTAETSDKIMSDSAHPLGKKAEKYYKKLQLLATNETDIDLDRTILLM